MKTKSRSIKSVRERKSRGSIASMPKEKTKKIKTATIAEMDTDTDTEKEFWGEFEKLIGVRK